MKQIYKTVLSVLLVTTSCFASEIVTPEPAKKCACGPTEHWLYKSSVANYMTKYPDAGLLVNNDTEDLPEKVVKAIDMIAYGIKFIDNNVVIVPKQNAKGRFYLPLSEDADYKRSKEYVKNICIATPLTAQEIYNRYYLPELCGTCTK